MQDRLPARARLLATLLLLSALPGCRLPHRQPALARPRRPGLAATHGTVPPYEAPGLPMVERLKMIDASIDPIEVPNENSKKAAMLHSRMQSAPDPDSRETLRVSYADELLKAGDTQEAIRQFGQVAAYAKAHHPAAWADARDSILFATAVAYLRLGEQDNCLTGHTSESCLLPIQGGGIHRVRRGSEGAIHTLLNLLHANPKHYGAIWLLNIAYMTLGEYPAHVPPAWLIPPAAFKSDYDIGRFHDIAGALGLDLNQLSGGTIIEDFDGDGNLDVMVSSIGTHDQLRLFHNNGDGTFSDRTKEAGLTGETGGLNILQTDYNNDGRPDVLVLRGAWYGKGGHWPMSLLRNDGTTFTDVTEEAGLLRFHPTQTAVWFDYNNDGWLDLFVGNESTPGDENPCELFRNNGDGTFTECAAECGLDFRGYVKAVVSADYNNDGRPDLFLSVNGRSNVLFRNDGPAGAGRSPGAPWKFTDVTKQAGVGEPIRSFSCFFFDYDNDGWPDLFVVGYNFDYADVGQAAKDRLGLGRRTDTDYSCLYHNNHDGTFTDVTAKAHLGSVAWGMGINFGDLDGDGWLDFYVGTGKPDLAFLVPNRMFRNAEGRWFQDVSASGGFGHLQKGHAISFGDLNNSGNQDVFESMGGIIQSDTAYDALYENPGHGNHWITLKLEGVRTNRAAIGARIHVTTTGGGKARDIYRTVGTGGSFGANPLRQEIGLGHATAIQKVEIFWPVTGATQTLTGLALDHFYRVREGAAKATPWPLKKFAFANGGAHPHHHAMPGMAGMTGMAGTP